MKPILLDISEEEWKQFKSKCILEGKSMRKRVTELVLKDIGNSEKSEEEIGERENGIYSE